MQAWAVANELLGRDDHRKEVFANSTVVEAKIEQLRQEIRAAQTVTTAVIQNLQAAMENGFDKTDQAVAARFDKNGKAVEARFGAIDSQFRWMVGLLVACLVGMMGMFARVAHLY